MDSQMLRRDTLFVDSVSLFHTTHLYHSVTLRTVQRAGHSTPEFHHLADW